MGHRSRGRGSEVEQEIVFARQGDLIAMGGCSGGQVEGKKAVTDQLLAGA